MPDATCLVDGCEAPTNSKGMCKPHYRKDYYERNKARENASNKAYRDARPEYWKSRWAEYADKRWGPEREARALAFAKRLASTHKGCTKCGEFLPKESFYEDRSHRDGLYSWCKPCFNAHTRANVDKQARVERNRHRYRTEPAYAEGRRARHRDWSRRNPERCREHTNKRRALKLQSMTEPVDYMAILEEHGMICHICTIEIESLSELHFDHVIPLSKGGAHSHENIKPAHAFCNLSKGAKLTA